MYNTPTSTENQTIGFVVEHLTSKEMDQLKSKTTGYGRIRGFSREVGIHENTLRWILLKGSGKPDTIQLIRQKLSA